MKHLVTPIAAAAFCILGAGAAQADCAADLAMLEGTAGTTGGIAKDGSLAPLQKPGTAAGTSTGTDSAAAPPDAGTAPPPAGAEGIAKDGTHMPLEGQAAESGKAMSGQDAQAQQQGQPTAAEQAGGAASTTPATGSDARSAALERARTALSAGDEQACLTALKEVAAM